VTSWTGSIVTRFPSMSINSALFPGWFDESRFHLHTVGEFIGPAIHRPETCDRATTVETVHEHSPRLLAGFLTS
jgi:hypothetical protein